ncbi:MAG TPA: FAD-binding protein [Syntrophorhabdaceae bacterium]|nr:FAD-binding protein [Syntrophorhabdaceae bacterium]
MGNRVIVVGAGLAGMAAAIAACEEGAGVTLIDRGSVGLGTNSAISNGFFTGTTDSYGADDYVKDTMEIGRYLNRKRTVETVAEKAPGVMAIMRGLGVPMNISDSLYAVRPPNARTIPGVTLVKQLAAAAGARREIHIVRDLYVTGIMAAEGTVTGVEGIDKEGRDIVFNGDSVVLATGGAGAVYLRNDNQKNIMGQGYCLAARAGLALMDMEFVQFFPIVVSGEHLPDTIVYPPFHKEVRLVNSAGENLIEKYGLGSLSEAAMKRRDELSILLCGEAGKGAVLLDYRRVPDELWGEHPLSLLSLIKHDFKTKLLPVSPAVHFMMGGVRTDEDCRTGLAGLFACGEVSWGLHGANRRGGNALMECAVFGTTAGRNAAHFNGQGRGRSASAQAEKGRQADRGAIRKGAQRTLSDIRHEIRRAAWDHAGVVRSEQGLKKGLEITARIGSELAGIIPEGRRQVCLKADLDAALFTLRAILTASLGRKESRGSFYRSDFPVEDDANCKKNSSLTYDRANDTFASTYVETV